MNTMKSFITKYIVVTLCVILVGCGDMSVDQMPMEIRNAPKPITITAISPDGIILTDSDGEFYIYSSSYHIAQAIIGSNLTVGDTLGTKPKNNQLIKLDNKL